MGLFDMFRSKATASSTDDVSGIMITLDAAEKQSLFILLAQDGTINRLGTGAEDNTDNAMFIGMSDGTAFAQVCALAGPVIDKWIGGYGLPDPEGKPCKLVVGFQTSDGRELLSHWEYGSESQGPPPEVASRNRRNPQRSLSKTVDSRVEKLGLLSGGAQRLPGC